MRGVKVFAALAETPLQMDRIMSIRKCETNVLLVEDDDGDALIVRSLLEAVPLDRFVVEHVGSAKSAVRRLDQGGIDVVVLDLGLPDSEGFDTVLRFRTLFPSLPVVVITGIDDEEVGLQAIQCGAQDYIAKGLIAGQLLFRAIRFAIARQTRIQGFKDEARTDTLTDLANRRAFDVEIERQLKESHRYGRPLSLVLLDVDHFKFVNDAYGHRAGDRVLHDLGTIIADTVRANDIAARFGGDEFAVILPFTNVQDAGDLVRQLLYNIGQHSYEHENQLLELTVSGGVTLALASDDVAALIERADMALYAAKANGRNRACCLDGEKYEDLHPTASVDYLCR